MVTAARDEQPGAGVALAGVGRGGGVWQGRVDDRDGDLEVAGDGAGDAGRGRPVAVDALVRRHGRAEREPLALQLELALPLGLAPVPGEQLLLGRRRHRGRDHPGRSDERE